MAWQTHLSDAEVGRLELLLDEAGGREPFEAFFADPVARFDDLRADPALPVTVAWADMLPKLLGWFTPVEGIGIRGWEHDPGRSGPLGDEAVCVTWAFSGTYETSHVDRRRDGEVTVDDNTDFNGLRSLGQPVELRGVTFMGVDMPPGPPNAPVTEPTFRLRRHVDWADCYAQLGLTLGWRVPHEASRRARRP